MGSVCEIAPPPQTQHNQPATNKEAERVRMMVKKKGVPNVPCAEGRAMGEVLVHLTEPEIVKLAADGEEDQRCKSCAFRLGTVPNGCLTTQGDALKAVMEGVVFNCHQTDRLGFPCFGWFAARQAVKHEPPVICPWDFSDDPDKEP